MNRRPCKYSESVVLSPREPIRPEPTEPAVNEYPDLVEAIPFPQAPGHDAP